MHVPSATGGSNADGRPTADLSLRELFDLNSYWLAINILWGALGISLLPILIIDHGLRRRPGLRQPDTDPRRHRGPEGDAPRRSSRRSASSSRSSSSRPSAAISDYTSTRWGGASRTSSSARSSTWSSCSASTSRARWIGLARLLRPPPVQLEFRAGPVPGLHAGPRAGTPGRPGQRTDGADDPARDRRRGDPRRPRRPRSATRARPSS